MKNKRTLASYVLINKEHVKLTYFLLSRIYLATIILDRVHLSIHIMYAGVTENIEVYPS
jgi:hypothetical protein